MGASAIGMQERIRLEIRGRARAECTVNIVPMLVTPEMSKLSGWLNFGAPCRVAREVMRYVGEVQSGRREGGGCGGGASRMQGRAWLEVRGEGTHAKHLRHACDAGRVKAQRLVELVRVLPSRKDGT